MINQLQVLVLGVCIDISECTINRILFGQLSKALNLNLELDHRLTTTSTQLLYISTVLTEGGDASWLNNKMITKSSFTFVEKFRWDMSRLKLMPLRGDTNLDM